MGYVVFQDKGQENVSLWSLKSIRFYMAFLLMFVIFSSVVMRDNLGIAVVCMVNSTAYENTNAYAIANSTSLSLSPITENKQCKNLVLLNENKTETSKSYEGTFQWTPTMQGVLFSALSYGSTITVLFSGYLADLYGPRRVAMLALVIYSSLTLLSPIIAEFSYIGFLLARSVMGLAEGCIFPSVAALSSRWFPPNERSTAAAIYTSGYQLGNGLGVLTGAKLCSIPLLGGWPLIFYFSGILGVLCLVFWYFVAANTPNHSKIMSSKEKAFLNHQLQDVNVNKKKNGLKVPWLKIFTSPALMAILVARFSYECQMVIMQSFLPSYFRDVLNLEIETNGLFAAIPFASLLITKNIISVISDKLKQSGMLSMTASCKILQSFGAFGTSAVLICMAIFLDCTRQGLALILLILFGICFSGFMPGAFTAMISIAPAYTGTIASIGSGSTVLAKILTPTIIGLVNVTGTRKEWALVFFMASVLNIIAGIVFLIFGSAEVQPWAKSDAQANKVGPVKDEETIKKW